MLYTFSINMARLPSPGSDSGVWGDILNDFLSVEHTASGTLKKAGDIAQAQADAAAAKATADALDTGVLAVARNSSTGVWPNRPTATVVMWIETQPNTPRVPPGMTNGDTYTGPGGMEGLNPGDTP